jgi:hypothetical protein
MGPMLGNVPEELMERLSVRFLKYDSTFIYVNFDNNLTILNKIKKKKKKK